jgi:hypothetical protein
LVFLHTIAKDVRISAGDYQLAATWDWDPLPVGGTLHLHPYGDFAHVTLAPEAHDKLIEGNGTVAVELSGADFEFLEKVAIESTARDAKALEVAFTLPSGKRAGPQNSVTVNFETAKQGSYRLLLTQAPRHGSASESQNRRSSHPSQHGRNARAHSPPGKRPGTHRSRLLGRR